MAGFRSALFLLGLGSPQDQAGFRNPLPIPPMGGSSAPVQAGFIGPIPIVNLGATESVIPPTERPVVIGRAAGGPGDYTKDRIILTDDILHPDLEEEWLLVAAAFLELQK